MWMALRNRATGVGQVGGVQSGPPCCVASGRWPLLLCVLLGVAEKGPCPAATDRDTGLEGIWSAVALPKLKVFQAWPLVPSHWALVGSISSPLQPPGAGLGLPQLDPFISMHPQAEPQLPHIAARHSLCQVSRWAGGPSAERETLPKAPRHRASLSTPGGPWRPGHGQVGPALPGPLPACASGHLIAL